MPPIIVQLIAAVVGEIFRQLLLNLPALESGLRQINTSTAADATSDPAMTAAVQDELTGAIDSGEVEAP